MKPTQFGIRALLLAVCLVACLALLGGIGYRIWYTRPATSPEPAAPSHAERIARKREYVKQMRRERSPIDGWVRSESTGDERNWGLLENPFNAQKATANVEIADHDGVDEMLMACDIHTSEILYAPPKEDLQKLIATSARILGSLNQNDESQSPTEQTVFQALAATTRELPEFQLTQLRATEDGRTYPKLTIDLNRDERRQELPLARTIREQYGYELAAIHKGVITARMDVPVLTESRKDRELRIAFLFDKATGDWIATTLEMRPDPIRKLEAMNSASTRQDQIEMMQKLRDESRAISLVEISPNIALLAE